MKIFLVIAIISLCFSQSFTLVLECFFDQELLFDDLKVSYTCSVKNLTTNSTFRSVSNIHGEHVDRNTDDDVTQLYIIHENMEYFPIGFTKYFKNLVAVHAGMNKMKFLEKDDLKDFDNLRFLYLYNNRLEVLQSDVFEHTKALEYVSLHSNRLMHIGAKILLPMKHLKNAYFNRNICIDKQAASEQGMSELRLEIAQQCSDITDEDLMNTLKQNQAKIEELEATVKIIGENLANVLEIMRSMSEGNKTN